MITVLNVGNTHTQIAAYDPETGEFSGVRIEPTADFSLSELSGELAAACVVPEVGRELGRRGAFLVDAEHCAKLDLSAVDRTTVGADRLANAVELRSRREFPAAVMDFGTAITLEALDADGRFIGGAIMPGRALLRRILAQGTAQLPVAEWSEEPPDKVGTDTDSAIRLGVDRGAIGGAAAVIGTARRQLGSDLKVTATGGDAGLFMRHIENLIDGGPLFTLRGIVKCWENG
ncbi:MAG: type III pantothenate kinase [Victivallaceae bacterium]|nr:type III pantothenate kinase [Victivallaceae bacterium]